MFHDDGRRPRAQLDDETSRRGSISARAFGEDVCCRRYCSSSFLHRLFDKPPGSVLYNTRNNVFITTFEKRRKEEKGKQGG